jgi:serine/threonine-protein kinase
MARAFISYTGHAKPDATLAAYLAQYLTDRHHDIFIQTKIAPGQSWPAVVDAKLKDADHVIVLLSTQSASSDMVIEEVRRAVELKQAQGRPVILPVQLGTVEMPYDLGAKVNRVQHLTWAADGDEPAIATRLEAVLSGCEAVAEEVAAPAKATALSADGAQAVVGAALASPLAAFDASWLKSLDAQGGAVRLDSPFYVERAHDDICKQRSAEKGKTLLIRGSRQSGKSSTLAHLSRETAASWYGRKIRPDAAALDCPHGSATAAETLVRRPARPPPATPADRAATPCRGSPPLRGNASCTA